MNNNHNTKSNQDEHNSDDDDCHGTWRQIGSHSKITHHPINSGEEKFPGEFLPGPSGAPTGALTEYLTEGLVLWTVYRDINNSIPSDFEPEG